MHLILLVSAHMFKKMAKAKAKAIIVAIATTTTAGPIAAAVAAMVMAMAMAMAMANFWGGGCTDTNKIKCILRGASQI